MADTTETKHNSFGELISVIFQALILALIIRTLLFQPFSIPSGSMRPTLLEGDYLFVSKLSYGYSRHSLPFSPNLFPGRVWSGDPARGDVAVFKHPVTNIVFIKRVIGLPGERIQVRDGQVFINGEAIQRELTGQIDNVDITEETRPVDVYRETLPNGVSYNTLDLSPRAPGDNTREFTIPEGHYFMMGDNRDNSNDSRMGVGTVPLENFLGRANIVFFSIAGGASPLEVWRWPAELRIGRFFSSAQR
ncbi:signal peptidase I [Oricola sp.]|uniref:signal peptidase I n=1 Tax=Oricola sp. TaxID=1979950 RepID=UPI003BAD27BE